MQVRSTGYALMQLLALHLPEAFPFNEVAPWRKREAVVTAGLLLDAAAFLRRCVSPRL
ncbi:MAG: hypothetical protein JF606_23645 [Burkholderiales bacterium]|nr:hypothetical protein [Burkholderiales bacterium]